uniref:Metallothionein-like protein n=1 Tax=Kalanchoe fedtschenkoi TaxID=63787 RepID=A0A7N0TDC2_KALFE
MQVRKRLWRVSNPCLCSMYPDTAEKTAAQTLIVVEGVASAKMYVISRSKQFHDEMGAEGSENGCNCGSSCSCDPCSCK